MHIILHTSDCTYTIASRHHSLPNFSQRRNVFPGVVTVGTIESKLQVTIHICTAGSGGRGGRISYWLDQLKREPRHKNDSRRRPQTYDVPRFKISLRMWPSPPSYLSCSRPTLPILLSHLLAPHSCPFFSRHQHHTFHTPSPEPNTLPHSSWLLHVSISDLSSPPRHAKFSLQKNCGRRSLIY